MYRLAAKRTEKTVWRKREREFFETQKTTRALVYSALLTVKISVANFARHAW